MRLPHGSLWRVRKHLNAHLCSPQMSRQYFWSMHDVWNESSGIWNFVYFISWSKYIKFVFSHLQACWKSTSTKYFSTENNRWTMRYKLIDDLILSIIFILNVMIVLPLKANPDCQGLPVMTEGWTLVYSAVITALTFIFSGAPDDIRSRLACSQECLQRIWIYTNKTVVS